MSVSSRFSLHHLRFAIVALFSAVSCTGTASAEPLASFPGGVIAEKQARLEAVWFKLAQANARRCDRPQMLTGLLVHNIGSYPAPERAIARELYNLTDGFGVLHIVPKSPAERVGLAIGDEIVALNGTAQSDLAVNGLRSRATYDRIEKFTSRLDDALTEGAARVTVRRGSSHLEVVLIGEAGCGGRTAYKSRSKADAWSDGQYVAITSGMIDFVGDNEELAFVVAHEMAHNILGHSARLKPAHALLAQFGIGADKIKNTEIAADQLAIELMAEAGYDVTASERVLHRLSRLIPLDLGLTHPRVSRRVQIVNTAIAKLKASKTLASFTD